MTDVTFTGEEPGFPSEQTLQQEMQIILERLATIEQSLTPASPPAGGGGGGGGTVESSTAEVATAAAPTLSILTSPTQRWLFDSRTGLYYVEYQLPGGTGTLLFEAEAEQIAALFPDGPPSAANIQFETYIGREDVHFAGNVAEMEGTGSFEDEYQRTVALALDSSNLPDWISSSPQALDILFTAISEDRTDEWFYSQLAKTASFKERYPGVQSLMARGLSVQESVRAFTEYETRLKTLHAAAGFDSTGVTPRIVGQLLERGYSIDQVAQSYQVWQRMNKYAPALEAFNAVLEANGQQPLLGTQLYDFLTGNAPQELYDIYEASSITEAARAAGLGDVFDPNDALSLALETSENLTVNEAYAAFRQVAQQALRFRHELNVEQLGLTIDDLIDLSFGRAPRSGKEPAEVGEILARITNQAEAFLQDRVTPFFGFSRTGRPQAVSFGELRRESV